MRQYWEDFVKTPYRRREIDCDTDEQEIRRPPRAWRCDRQPGRWRLRPLRRPQHTGSACKSEANNARESAVWRRRNTFR